jgi:hypothetical protein
VRTPPKPDDPVAVGWDKLPRDEQPAAGSTVTLFLALYLVVLAFFIVLVSISSPEKVKSKAVMDSLTSVFASVLPPKTSLTAFAADEGDVIAAREFQRTVSDMFATQLRVARVEEVQPGRLMRVSLPVEAMFQSGQAVLRENRLSLLDRIVAAISARPPGLRFDMEFVVGRALAIDGPSVASPTAEINRAGAFARQMLARGAPPDSISVAVGPGDPGQALITFYVRSLDDAVVPFGETGTN